MILKRLLVMLVSVVLFSIPALSQNKVVTGKVTDSKNGSAVPNATVKVTGTEVITQTDSTGAFTFSVPQSATSLTISSVGYGTQDVSIGNGNVLVKLAEVTTSLGDVVVIGYGTVRKKDLTGAVNTISAKDFNQGLATTPEQLIAGKVAGVQITSNGGQPGQGSVIRIRQGASLNASNDPLVVIDGVPLEGGLNATGGENQSSGASNYLALVNPDDIETFTILKDAASTAIYGSRASNGVILITTKKGKRGKPVFNFSTQNSISAAAKYVPVLSAAQFKDYVNTYGNASQIAMLGDASTDWQKEIYRAAFGTNNNLSVSGSIPEWNNTPYRASIGYTNQNGILKTDNFERVTAALRISPSFFTNHLKVDVNANGAYTDSRFGNQDAIGAAVRMDPSQAIYQPGSVFGGYYERVNVDPQTGKITPNTQATFNPYALLMQKHDIGYNEKLFGNVQFDYKFHFLPDLHANLNLGLETAKGWGTTTKDSTDASAWYSGSVVSGLGSRTKYQQKIDNKTFEFYLAYNKYIPQIKSNINATAGYGYYDYLTTNYNYPSLYNNPITLTDTAYHMHDTVPSSINPFPFDKPRYTLLSYYARLIYTYNNKYTLTASFRTDGSSRFPKNNRWGKFPTIALGWDIKQEDFLQSAHAISDLKLRLSYGVTGQQAGIPLYSYIPNFNYGTAASLYQIGNTFYTVLAPLGYNPNIKWEQTATYNVGVDFGFLHNRITGSIDLYNKKTTNLLNTVNITPGIIPANQITDNVGDMETKGVEFLINLVPVRNKEVEWNLGFNMSYNYRKITKLTVAPDPTYIGFFNTSSGVNGTGSLSQINSVGYQPNQFFLYQQVYDKTTGKPIEGAFVDQNGDGQITAADLIREKSPYPTWIYGFSTSIRYKKATLSTALHANVGNYVFNQVRSNAYRSLLLNPLGYLQNATTEIYYSNFIQGTDLSNLSDYWLENASFLKMDNIALSYNFGNICKARRSNLTASFSVQNVFTVTKYKGLDPEVYSGIDNNPYPRPRIFMLGLNFGF